MNKVVIPDKFKTTIFVDCITEYDTNLKEQFRDGLDLRRHIFLN